MNSDLKTHKESSRSSMTSEIVTIMSVLCQNQNSKVISSNQTGGAIFDVKGALMI